MRENDEDGTDVEVPSPGPEPVAPDPTRPSVARMYDYYLGGKDNLAVDREVGDRLLVAFPDARHLAQVNRRFLVDAVRFMAESGVRQFLDVGAGIPTSPGVHEVARGTHPDASVVYVDDDPVVVAHSTALAACAPGVVAVRHDLRRPADILADPRVRAVVDLDQPVGLLFVAVLHFVDHAVSRAVMARFHHALAPGSMTAVSVLCTEGMSQRGVDRLRSLYANSSAPAVFRDRAEVEELFDGYDLVEPGLVDFTRWRADGSPGSIRCLAGVGRRR